ncbi:MAG: hypothetical protein REI45_10220 [Propionicimonas sp.]|nr:hypothetical protein [Propionicimonas sp.]
MGFRLLHAGRPGGVTAVLDEPWLPWNQIAGAVLVYLPIGLAAAAAWLTRKRPLSTVVVTHLVAIPLSLIFWVL